MLTVVLFSIIPCLLFFVVPNTYALFKNVSSDALFQLKNEVQYAKSIPESNIRRIRVIPVYSNKETIRSINHSL